MEIRDLTITYEERSILRHVNISIEKWEFIFLIGASGSGKTSFLSALLGIIKPKSWTITDNLGRNISLLSPHNLLMYRRSIWVIFQDFKLLPRKTVRENVAFAMEVCGYSEREMQRRIPEVLSQVWLLEKKEKFIETLSGGEVQRVCIARALIHNPDTIIGDEPTGNLDKKNALEILHLLRELHKKWKTIIIATHDDTIVNNEKKRVIAFGWWKIISDMNPGTYSL